MEKEKVKEFLKTNNLPPKLYMAAFFSFIVILGISTIVPEISKTEIDIKILNWLTLIPSIFIMIGNILSFLKKEKGDQTKSINIGVITAMLMQIIREII